MKPTARHLGVGLTLCLLLALVAVTAGVGIAQQQERQTQFAEGSPDLQLYVPDNTFTPSTADELTIQLDNEGQLDRGQEAQRERVTTARSVVVDVDDDDAPLEVNTNAQSLGTIDENTPREASFAVEVPNDAEPGVYEIDVELSYDYTSRVITQPGIVNDQRQRSRTVTETIEIEIDDSARFRVTDVDSTLRVGEEGEITGNLTNVGGEDATNAQVDFIPESQNIIALETDVAVGDVPAGESREFSIPVEVGSEARAVDKRFDLPVTFRDENGIRAADEDPEFLVEIGEKRDEFIIEAVNRSIAAGSTQTLTFEVTNNRGSTVTDVEAKLFTNDPLDSDEDEAFIESLEPGESETVVFGLSAASGATAKTYPVSVDFRYDDERGRSKLSESSRVAIDVTEADDSGLPTIPLLIGLVVVGAAGVFLWRRKSGDGELLRSD